MIGAEWPKLRVVLEGRSDEVHVEGQSRARAILGRDNGDEVRSLIDSRVNRLRGDSDTVDVEFEAGIAVESDAVLHEACRTRARTSREIAGGRDTRGSAAGELGTVQVGEGRRIADVREHRDRRSGTAAVASVDRRDRGRCLDADETDRGNGNSRSRGRVGRVIREQASSRSDRACTGRQTDEERSITESSRSHAGLEPEFLTAVADDLAKFLAVDGGVVVVRCTSRETENVRAKGRRRRSTRDGRAGTREGFNAGSRRSGRGRVIAEEVLGEEITQTLVVQNRVEAIRPHAL